MTASPALPIRQREPGLQAGLFGQNLDFSARMQLFGQSHAGVLREVDAFRVLGRHNGFYMILLRKILADF